MKKIFVVMMVKDEIDIIGYNIEYLQTQDIDHFYIANNLSTDGTKELLVELSEKYKNITIIDDNEFAYYQSDKMNLWCNTCFKMGADIVIPIDADEVWYSKDKSKTLGTLLRETDGDIFVATSTDYIPTKNDNASNNPIISMAYKKKNSDSFPAVAFNKYPGFYLEMGNHDVSNHKGKRIYDLIGIRHYQYRSFSQFEKKVLNGKKVYDTTDFPNFIGSHWRKLGSMSKEEMMSWWDNYISQEVEYDPIQVKNYPCQ
jgi:glycosyltransferase involved in cell wall biosynthesis